MSGGKRLDQMDDLRDLGKFPLTVCAGAAVNILFTVLLTRFVQGKFPNLSALPVWAGGITALNVLPVFLLRSRMDEDTVFPEIEEMDFFADQHKFAGWVYGAASANMVSWVSLAWLLFSRRQDRLTLVSVLILACVGTSFPAWIRLFTDDE